MAQPLLFALIGSAVNLRTLNGVVVGKGVALLALGRDLHSSAFRLNLSAFCGIGGAFRGCSGGVGGAVIGCSGVFRRCLGGVGGY